MNTTTKVQCSDQLGWAEVSSVVYFIKFSFVHRQTSYQSFKTNVHHYSHYIPRLFRGEILKTKNHFVPISGGATMLKLLVCICNVPDLSALQFQYTRFHFVIFHICPSHFLPFIKCFISIFHFKENNFAVFLTQIYISTSVRSNRKFHKFT